MNKRYKLALATFCRGFLHFNGFITDSENDRIHNRIISFKIKNNITISREQLDSIDIIYKD